MTQAGNVCVEQLTPTSAVGLHRLSSSCASVPQARGHVLPSLALRRLCRLWFRWLKRRQAGHNSHNLQHSQPPGLTVDHLKSDGVNAVLTVPEPAGFSLSAVESPSCSASSFCMGPRVSLYGQRVVQWSPLQIRQDTIFCPFSLFIGSSSWSWAFKSCKR